MAIDRDAVFAALATVQDPEIHRPITEIGMVDSVELDGDKVSVTILLTISSCPMKDRLRTDVTAAVMTVPGVSSIDITMGTMTDAQRAALREKIHGPGREIPFGKPTCKTRVLAIASGKGGVGKSSVTVNLAMSLLARGLTVGILDADIYGHSIPGILGIPDAKPTGVEGMVMPVPVYGLKVISMGMLKENRQDIVAWRGPILDKALGQLLTDVAWGDLDFLLIDLPPGTGDIAMSLGGKVPSAEIIVVTTPQEAAAEVAERAGAMAALMEQKVLGVVENMSYLDFTAPDTGTVYRIDVFGSGGGEATAKALTKRCGYTVEVLGSLPLDPKLREGGDAGAPIVMTDLESPVAKAFAALAEKLAAQGKPLAGVSLGLTPTH